MSTNSDVSPEMDTSQMSPSEYALAHYGVKGMQWGKRKADDGGVSTATRKPTKQEIGDARFNIAQQGLKLRQTKSQAKQFDKGSVERAIADKRYNEMKTDFLKNPDRVTASYLTTGEKYAFAAIAIAAAPVGGVQIVGGNVASRAVTRRRIQRRQRTGFYDKK